MLTRAAWIVAFALALSGCTAQHVIGIGYIAAQVAPRAPSTFKCEPPRIERQGICARPDAFGGMK